jgi:Flp pilus assembly protein TadD
VHLNVCYDVNKINILNEILDFLIPGLDERVVVFIETGRNTEALADCEHAIVLNQDYADAWSKKGHALYNLERYEDAVFACTRALALNGNDATAWYIKGVCLDEIGRNDEAQEAYGKSLELEIILEEAEKKKFDK